MIKNKTVMSHWQNNIFHREIIKQKAAQDDCLASNVFFETFAQLWNLTDLTTTKTHYTKIFIIYVLICLFKWRIFV